MSYREEDYGTIESCLELLREYLYSYSPYDRAEVEGIYWTYVRDFILKALKEGTPTLNDEDRASLELVVPMMDMRITNRGKEFSAASVRQRKACFERDLYRCLKCGTHLDLQIDHIKEVCEGGTHELENLQTICKPCHLKKTHESILKRRKILYPQSYLDLKARRV